MPDAPSIREIVDDALRYWQPNRFVEVASITAKANARHGLTLDPWDVEAVLTDYERQGKVRLAKPIGNTSAVTHVAEWFLDQLRQGA